MEEHETVLSEVHLGLSVESNATNVLSRFEFIIPSASLTSPCSSGMDLIDSEYERGKCSQTNSSSEELTQEESISPCSSENVGVSEEENKLEVTSGDLSPPRRNDPREVLLIEHNMATSLAEVGLQVRSVVSIQ